MNLHHRHNYQPCSTPCLKQDNVHTDQTALSIKGYLQQLSGTLTIPYKTGQK